MTVPFIQSDNVFFVPVIRQRLNFAVLVRQAFFTLPKLFPPDWDSHDLIAVALPGSLLEPVKKSINRLPKVSLLLASVTDQKQWEAVPVTPCDGVIEAIRLATEHNIPLETIEPELAPGNLLGRMCMQDPDFPDDTLACRFGARAYLSLVEPQLNSSVSRREPVDSWRERHMAEKLRQLQPFRRRVLVVCDAAQVNGVSRILSSRNQPFVDISEPDLNLEVRDAGSLKLDVLLRYLDDYPRLAELYELQRSDSSGQFDKTKALRRAFHEVANSAADLQFSTRQHQIFASFMNNVLKYNKRICPKPNSFFEICKSCFGQKLAERVIAHLGGYFDYLRMERVGLNDSAATSVLLISNTLGSTKKPYAGRSCNPHSMSYVSYRVIGGRQKKKDSNEFYDNWPPHERFIERMRSKLERISKKKYTETKVRQFSGSIEGGIDRRRTIRSYLSESPKLYVRQIVKKQQMFSIEREPNVWIFDEEDPEDFTSNPDFFINTQFIRYFRITGRYHIKDVIYESPNKLDTIKRYQLKGFLTFSTINDKKIDLARRLLGDSFEKRIPNHNYFTHGEARCILPELVHLVNVAAPWWEVALLTAARYAKHSVLCVLPPGFRIPRSVSNHPLARGKSFRCVSMLSFSRKEREDLSTGYEIQSVGATDRSDEDLEKTYGRIFKQYFPE